MADDFFEKELKKARLRFNEAFGSMTVCDLKLRQSAIIAIIQLGRLSEKIMRTKCKGQVRNEIKNFVRAKSILSNIFNKIDEYQKERSRHEGNDSNGRCNGRRQCGGVPKLRERIQNRASQAG